MENSQSTPAVSFKSGSNDNQVEINNNSINVDVQLNSQTAENKEANDILGALRKRGTYFWNYLFCFKILFQKFFKTYRIW